LLQGFKRISKIFVTRVAVSKIGLQTRRASGALLWHCGNRSNP
jgi:hypothetical protein